MPTTGDVFVTQPSRRAEPWGEEEIKALIEFILFYEREDKWPCHKHSAFWKGAGTFIQVRCKTPHLRSGDYIFFPSAVFFFKLAVCRFLNDIFVLC